MNSALAHVIGHSGQYSWFSAHLTAAHLFVLADGGGTAELLLLHVCEQVPERGVPWDAGRDHHQPAPENQRPERQAASLSSKMTALDDDNALNPPVAWQPWVELQTFRPSAFVASLSETAWFVFYLFCLCF